MTHFRFLVFFCTAQLAACNSFAADGPVARWKLAGDVKNSVATGPHGENRAVTFEVGDFPAQSAKFDGRGSSISIPAAEPLKLGNSDFTISLWVHTDAESDDDLGDIVSQFDAASRTGFHLSLRNNAGVTHSQANYCQLQFGIDSGTEPLFKDEGRPGNAVYGQTMAVHRGKLYVGTCEPGNNQAGHLYRYDGTNQWTDCGTPDKANSITGMAAYRGDLYVGSGKYRLGGSALRESENPHFGGRIFRYLGDAKWEEVGHFPEMEAVGGMVVFRGKLYVGSLYKPAAFFRYDGEKRWTPLEVPNGKRVEALGVFNGHLWATGYDEGHVYRFDGKEWTDLGRVGDLCLHYLQGTTASCRVEDWKGVRMGQGSLAGSRSAGRRTGSHGNARPQRQFLRRNVAAWADFPLRGEPVMDDVEATRHDTRRHIPPGLDDGPASRKTVRHNSSISSCLVSANRCLCHVGRRVPSGLASCRRSTSR